MLVNECFEVSDRLNIFQCAIGDLQIRGRHLPKFWDEALTAWPHILQNSGEIDEFMAQALFLYRNLKIESSLKSFQLRAMKVQYITYVNDLFNFSSKKWFTALEIKQKWSGLDIMTCNSVVSMIPSEWRSVRRCNDSTLDTDRALQTLVNVESTTKWAYSNLLKTKLIETCSCESKMDCRTCGGSGLETEY